MRLKKLELFGFKSFADKTTVLFDQGVTCIVGPNGCGKSNISDSIRWVLGERSAKMLRGSKMDDVIFAGTEFRKPLAMAEVSLTFDNTDRGLPIDYNEVTITRRLFRSGESAYLINKTACRLKDLQDLILDTGIGSNSYSMIEQGRIDYILSADPEKRRFLIEEAAGISKYKVKKEEALRKLGRTEENILRLNDIVQEVQKNIQYAERQAKRAEKYKEQYERLKDLEIRKSFYDLAIIEKESEALSQQKQAKDELLANLETQKRGCKEEIQQFEVILKEVVARYSAKESEKYQVRSLIEQNEQQLRFNEEKRIELATRKGEIQQEQHQLTERIERTVKELEVKREEYSRFHEEKKTVREDLDRAEERLLATESKLDEHRAQLDRSKNEAYEVAAELTRVKNEQHRILAFLETSAGQQSKLQANSERFQAERADYEARLQKNRSEVERYRNQSNELNVRVETLSAEASSLEEKVQNGKNSEAESQRLLDEKKMRLEMLQQLDSSERAGIEDVIAGYPALDADLVRNIRNVIKVQPGYESALESVLGDFSKFLITKNLEAAKRLADKFFETDQATVGLLVNSLNVYLNTVSQQKAPSNELILCSLKDVVCVEDGYRHLFQPFIENVFVARCENSAQLFELLELSREYQIVTQNGISFSQGRRIFIAKGRAKEQNFFERGNEIEKLIQEIRSLNGALEHTKSELRQWENENQTVKQTLGQLQKELMTCKITMETLESSGQGFVERLKSYERETELIGQELSELETQRNEAFRNKEALEREVETVSAREQDIRGHQEQIQNEIKQVEEIKNQYLREVAEFKSKFQHLEERYQLIEEAVNLLEENDANDRERIDALSGEALKISERISEIHVKDDELRIKLQELGDQSREIEISLSLIRTEKEGVEKKVAEKEEVLQGVDQQQQDAQNDLHQIEMRKMDMGYQGKNVYERLLQTYQLKLDEFKAEEYVLSEEALTTIDEDLEKLRGRVQSLGTVNLLAIEEYDELKKRHDFLMTQKQDMENARESLMEAIRRINRTTKGLFETTFNSVQQAFQEYYKILFRGGEAKLILLDEAHPLESGIDVFVRPPGKKLQNISLLSGGEKALTAIALLFALFKIKPSPFCVMDEVDAPLDEANIDRFLAVVKTFLTTSQFIIVTHNRKTIAMGDSLYGVTMEQAGVSKIVSVKVNPGEHEEGHRDVMNDSSKSADSEAVEDSGEVIEEPAVEVAQESSEDDNNQGALEEDSVSS